MKAASPTRQKTRVKGVTSRTATSTKKKEPPQITDNRPNSSHSESSMARLTAGLWAEARVCDGAGAPEMIFMTMYSLVMTTHN